MVAKAWGHFCKDAKPGSPGHPSAEDWGVTKLSFCFHGIRILRLTSKRTSQQVEEARLWMEHSPGQEVYRVCTDGEVVL